MASGSSRRASHSGTANPVEESRVSRSYVYPAATHEGSSNNLSSSHLLSELELLCCNLDKSIGELCSDFSCGELEESKLKSLERKIQEVHKRVQILKDKQELGNAQKELAKLHLAQKDPSSSSGGQNEEKTFSEPKDGHDHQQQQQVALPQPSSVPPLPATQPHQLLPAQTAPIASKDDFFCKLITNSIRALEKVQADDHKRNRELCIHVDLNKTHKTMSVTDNGIGMTKAELEMVLSSTHGVLCSAFVAADKVVVTTKHDEDEQYVFEASRGGDHCFKIDRHDDSESSLGIGRGTKIILFLKDDHLEYLEECSWERLVDWHFMVIDYRLVIRNYDSSNKCQDELVHIRGIPGWSRSTPIVSVLESYLLESFPDEVEALKKKIEEKKKKKRNKGEVSFEEKKKELESLRKVMAKVVRKQKVEKVVVSESSVFPKMACTLSVDPKSKAKTMEINPWEPNGILDWLAELVAEDSEKYYKVLKKIIWLLFKMAAFIKMNCSAFS